MNLCNFIKHKVVFKQLLILFLELIHSSQNISIKEHKIDFSKYNRWFEDDKVSLNINLISNNNNYNKIIYILYDVIFLIQI